MAGCSHFIWILVLFKCVFCTSDNRDVHEHVGSFISTGNPEVDKILSKIMIPDDIDPRNVNLTTVTIKTCVGIKEGLAAQQRQLQQASQRYNQLDGGAFELRNEVRQLKVQLATCMSTASSIAGTYQTHLQMKMNQMLGLLDNDTFLVFKIMTLTREVSALQEKIRLAANSNGATTETTELQRQMEEKMTELKDNTQQAEKSLKDATLILQIISLQNQIWDLQRAELRSEKTGPQETSDDRILVVKQQLNRKINQLRDKGDTNFANLLELISVSTRIAELKRMITMVTEKSKTYAADAKRKWSQKSELLKKKILQLNRDENNKTLTMEIMRLQGEVQHYAELMRNAKNVTNSQIQELRAALDREKQRQDVLQRQLEATEYLKAQLIMQLISIMEELKEQHQTDHPTTVLEAKEKEYAKAQATIRELQRKLQRKTEMCSKFEERYEQVKTDFDQKIAELNRTDDFRAALILKLINLHDELKALKEQISLSEDQNLTSELQTQLEKKQEELNSRIADIESLTSSPGTILNIIELQHELWNLRNKVANGTTSDRREELQDRLDGLINEINSRTGKSTKLILKIVTLQSQVEHLETLRSKTYNETSPSTLIIRNNLTDELTFKRTELQKHIKELNETNPSNARLILSITDLYKNLKRIETENRDDNATSSLTLTLLQMHLQSKNREYAIIKDKVTELERKLQLKTKECSTVEKRQEQLKTEFEQKIAELNRTKDFKTALILNVINMHAELRALREQISNSSAPEIISQLQKQLEAKQDELNIKTAEMEGLITNPRTILKIIELQDEIWELQNNDTSGTAADQIRDRQNTLDRLLGEIDSRSQENTKLTLKIVNLQSQVEHLQNLLSNREMLQTSKLTVLTTELEAKKAELEKYVNELKEKNEANAKLILNITDLQIQLENLEKVKTTEEQKTATISDLRKKLKIKEAEHSNDQEVILDLQQKLNETEAQCSDYEQKITDLQKNLDNKLKELQSKSDSVTSLALQISTLNVQLEQLNTQLKNSVSKSKADELQKTIDEKNEELGKLTKELKDRSAQPQRLLQIIAIQTQIEKLVTVAVNDSDYENIKALQEKLNHLVEGIQDEQNENTKLTFQILTQQNEIARLKNQEKKEQQTQAAEIKDLEDQLQVIRNQIKEKTALLNRSGMRIANLSAQIMELHMKIEPLEDEISELKEAHAQSFAELQRRLNLKERQLEDTESQLQHIDSRNLELLREISDLTSQLKQAQTQTSKTAQKKVKDIEKQLKTLENENKKLEASNAELKEELQAQKACCNQDNDQCEDLQRDLQQSHEDADRLQQQLRQKVARLNQLEQDLQIQIRENNQLQDAFDILQAEKNKLQKNVEELQEKLGQVENETIHTSKITFNPDTAHPRIVLSEDKTQMSTSAFLQNLPDYPGRFDVILGVLGATGFSSGRHYWEVSVAGKTCYQLGMTSESSPRKGSPILNPTNDYWTIVLDKQGQYKAIEKRSVRIPIQTQPVTLGILLDYAKGQISFYDSGARTHMYSFVGQRFTEKIYPFVNFCVEDGEVPAPIVLITPGGTDWIK